MESVIDAVVMVSIAIEIASSVEVFIHHFFIPPIIIHCHSAIQSVEVRSPNSPCVHCIIIVIVVIIVNVNVVQSQVSYVDIGIVNRGYLWLLSWLIVDIVSWDYWWLWSRVIIMAWDPVEAEEIGE